MALPISALEFHSQLEKEMTPNILDVREIIEFSTYNIGGQNLPLSKLSSSIDQVNYNKTDEIVVICKMGMRSETACKLLQDNGYQNVRNLSGGLIALQKIKQ